MGGGDGNGKSGGKGAGKGAGKGSGGPAVGSGPSLALSDEAWAKMSGKQRKLYMRIQNMVLHVNGPSYQAPAPKKAPGGYKEAAGSDHWGSESWYYSKGPWVPCQNSQAKAAIKMELLSPPSSSSAMLLRELGRIRKSASPAASPGRTLSKNLKWQRASVTVPEGRRASSRRSSCCFALWTSTSRRYCAR